MIAKPSALKRGLPKSTESLCPECKKVVPARIFEQDGKVMMEKDCPDHGKIVALRLEALSSPMSKFLWRIFWERLEGAIL